MKDKNFGELIQLKIENIKEKFSQRKWLFYVLVLVMFLLSFILKMEAFPRNIAWSGDVGRDQLISHLMVKYKDMPKIGHYNSGISFVYPPYYYYLLYLIRLMNDSLFFVYLSYVFLSTSVVFIVYQISKIIFDKWVAFLTSFYYLFSKESFIQAQSLFSVYWSQIFFIASSLFFVSGYIKDKKNNILLGLVAIVFTGTIFYGAYLFALFFLLLVAIKYIKDIGFIFKSILVSILSFVLFNVPLITYFGLNQAAAGLFKMNAFNNEISVEKIVNLLSIELEKFTTRQSYFFLAPLILVFFYSIFSKKITWKIVVLLVLVLIHYFFIIISSSYLEHYAALLLLPYLLLISALIISCIRDKQIYGKIIGIVSFVSISFSMINPFLITKHYYANTLINYREIAIKIVSSSTSESSVWIIRSEPLMFWTSPAIWYFLEKESHERLFLINHFGETGIADISYVSQHDINNFIFICDLALQEECEQNITSSTTLLNIQKPMNYSFYSQKYKSWFIYNIELGDLL